MSNKFTSWLACSFIFKILLKISTVFSVTRSSDNNPENCYCKVLSNLFTTNIYLSVMAWKIKELNTYFLTSVLRSSWRIIETTYIDYVLSLEFSIRAAWEYNCIYSCSVNYLMAKSLMNYLALVIFLPNSSTIISLNYFNNIM